MGSLIDAVRGIRFADRAYPRTGFILLCNCRCLWQSGRDGWASARHSGLHFSGCWFRCSSKCN